MTSERRATNVGRWPRDLGPVARPRRGRQVGLVVTTGLLAAAAVAAPSTVAASAPVPKLDWRPARRRQPGFQCAAATVPRNYSHPRRSKIHLAVIRHPATDPAHRIGTLFFNPGGPGQSGTAALAQGYKFFPPAVRARFDLVSWDPRGWARAPRSSAFTRGHDESTLLDGVGVLASLPVGKAKRKWILRYRAFGRRCERTKAASLRDVRPPTPRAT